MLSLDVFPGRVLHAALHLLQAAEAERVSLPALRAQIAAELDQRRMAANRDVRATVPRAARAVARLSGARQRCPSCGRGMLAPVANGDSLRILGCRLCRYSRIEGQ